jgi:DNA-binding NarL/FixJ family response regulator
MIRVAIVEDIDTIREGLKVLVGGSPGFACVGTFGSAEAALKEVGKFKINVILLDIHLPGMSGIEAIGGFKVKAPLAQVIMLTVFEDDENIFNALRAGASGYLLKKTPPGALLEAIEEVHRGGSPMSSQIARKVVHAFQQMESSRKESENLSPREQEILSHLAKGYRYKEIAEQLFISVETVRTHLHHIYEKLHVRSRTEAVVKFLGR